MLQAQGKEVGGLDITSEYGRRVAPDAGSQIVFICVIVAHLAVERLGRIHVIGFRDGGVVIIQGPELPQVIEGEIGGAHAQQADILPCRLGTTQYTEVASLL